MYATAVKPVKPEYRTQKAAGLKALKDFGFDVPNFEVFGVEHFGVESVYDSPVLTSKLQKKQDRLNDLIAMVGSSIVGSNERIYLDAAKTYLQEEIDRELADVTSKQLGLFKSRSGLNRFVNKFVRPCPMVPRHGFVDSRPIETIEEAEAIFEETLKAEDQAEFIVMPFIKAQYSAIWTTGKLVVGKGNDGATAGHSSRCIPALGTPTHKGLYHWQQLLEKANIKDAPYLELLFQNDIYYPETKYVKYVQLRNGPALPDSVDYIPEELTITNVVRAEGDLLEWETKAKNFTRGTCIYHPGGSLASHYSVHAVLSKIPVLISREPSIGETLKPNTDSPEPNLLTIRRGFVAGATDEMTYKTAAMMMLVGCHSTSVWLGRQDYLLGYAIGCAYRLTITAALGEFRHAPHRKRKPNRTKVYGAVWNKILNGTTRARYLKALKSFDNDPNWPSSFGGKKWYTFGAFAGCMFNSLLDGDIKGSFENLNKCVNSMHNSGWAFDKFVDRDKMDLAAKNPVYILLNVAGHCYETVIKGEQDSSPNWFENKYRIKVEEPVIEEKELRAARRDEAREMKGAARNSLCKENLGKSVKEKKV